MSELVDRIEQAIKEKGSNFKRVERECGLGNGTIKRWGEQSPRLDKLVLVSEYHKSLWTISSLGVAVRRLHRRMTTMRLSSTSSKNKV